MIRKSAYKFAVRRIGRSWRRFASAVLLCLMLILVVVLFFLASGIRNQTNWIEQSYALRASVNDVALLSLQMENNHRGYIITGNHLYLDKCYEAISDLNKTLARIHNYINSDERLAEHFGQIDPLIAEVQAASEEFLKLASHSDHKAAAGSYNIMIADAGIANLESMIRQFNEIEDEYLMLRIKKIERNRLYQTIVFALALACIFGLFLLLLFRKQRYIRILNEGRETLLLENEGLEQLIKERTVEVTAARELAEYERKRVELLLQDSNHRVGNSLAQVAALLNMQLRRTDDKVAKAAIIAARDRLNTVAIAHHRLRLTDDKETASIKEFLEAVVSDLLVNSGHKDHIKIHCDIADVNMSARDVTTLGIILGELITNSMKHGFADKRDGEIQIELKLDENEAVFLSVKDNGVGMNNENAAHKKSGLGMTVINQLCKQLGGEPTYSEGIEGGVCFEVKLTLLKIKP